MVELVWLNNIKISLYEFTAFILLFGFRIITYLFANGATLDFKIGFSFYSSGFFCLFFFAEKRSLSFTVQ